MVLQLVDKVVNDKVNLVLTEIHKQKMEEVRRKKEELTFIKKEGMFMSTFANSKDKQKQFEREQ